MTAARTLPVPLLLLVLLALAIADALVRTRVLALRGATRATVGSGNQARAKPTPAVRKSHCASTSAWRCTVTVASARENPIRSFSSCAFTGSPPTLVK